MLSKLLDETHWDGFSEIKEVVSKGKDRIEFSPGHKRSSFIEKFVDSCFDIVENKEFYNCNSFVDYINEEIEANGFDKLKAKVRDLFVYKFDNLVLYKLSDEEEASLDEEFDQLDLFLKETSDIREILETYQTYYLLMKESSNVK